MLVTSLSSIAIFSGLSAGYLILKNLLTNEEVEEVIETNNILKYEYYPVENINLETKEENIPLIELPIESENIEKEYIENVENPKTLDDILYVIYKFVLSLILIIIPKRLLMKKKNC